MRFFCGFIFVYEQNDKTSPLLRIRHWLKNFFVSPHQSQEHACMDFLHRVGTICAPQVLPSDGARRRPAAFPVEGFRGRPAATVRRVPLMPPESSSLHPFCFRVSVPWIFLDSFVLFMVMLFFIVPLQTSSQLSNLPKKNLPKGSPSTGAPYTNESAVEDGVSVVARR